MLLLLDNYDSFTYNLYDYFCRCGAQVEVIRNDKVDIDSIGSIYKGIILSPGPGTPKQAGLMMEIIDRYHSSLPFFGVCLGMQALGEYFGASLATADFPVHGKTSKLSYKKNHSLFAGITDPLHVCRYHSLIINNLRHTELDQIAETNKGEVMAIAHSSLPIWAVQFHPEAILTAQGLTLINNWLSFFNLQHKPSTGSVVPLK